MEWEKREGKAGVDPAKLEGSKAGGPTGKDKGDGWERAAQDKGPSQWVSFTLRGILSGGGEGKHLSIGRDRVTPSARQGREPWR